MKLRTRLRLLPFLLVGCNPYQYRSGEYYAGPVDPVSFPAAYLGDKGNAKKGGGVFRPSDAFVAGMPISYFSFPFPKAQAGPDPLRVPDPQRAADPMLKADMPAAEGV